MRQGILRNEKKLDELSPGGKRNSKANKVYVKEPLCPSHKRILGKCNSLLKIKYIAPFYTVKVKVKIKYEANNGNVSSVANQEADLVEIIGEEIADEMSIYYFIFWCSHLSAVITVTPFVLVYGSLVLSYIFWGMGGFRVCVRVLFSQILVTNHTPPHALNCFTCSAS